MSGIKRTLIWLKRFRHRRGYGVHSPFTYDFITHVIYEKTAYYAYREIEKQRDSNGRDITKEKKLLPKVDRFLFRLVNRMQPTAIIDAGGSGKTALYLQAAKKTASYIPVTSLSDGKSSDKSERMFLYISHPDKPQLVEATLEEGIRRAGQSSVVVIQGIYASAAMKSLWKRAVADERTGITFDLYDLGILFFDKSKIKQHYIVNF